MFAPADHAIAPDAAVNPPTGVSFRGGFAETYSYLPVLKAQPGDKHTKPTLL